MKKLIIFSVITFIFSSFNLQAQDLKKVLKKHYEAIGQEKLSDIKTMTSTGRAIQMGMELPFVLIHKRPSKMRMEAEVQGEKFIQAFDGENGWMVMPWTGSLEAQDMPQEQVKAMKQQSDIDGDLVNWEEKGFELSLEGKEEMDGSTVYKLLLKKDEEEGETIYYIDTEKYVIVRTDTKTMIQGTEMDATTYYSDYKEINGILMPHSIESKMDGEVISQIVIDTFEIDKDVDDSVFTKPE